MPSLSGILRIGVAALGLLACAFLLGGLLSYKRISAKDMQLKEVVGIRLNAGNTITNDYGAGFGALAFERGFSLTGGYSDKFEAFQVEKNNPELKRCWGTYKDHAKLIPDETTGCRTAYVSQVGVCDEDAANGYNVYVGEYEEDKYIEDTKANQRAAEKAGRQRGGEDGTYLASAFGALIIGISIAWWSNDQERKSVHVAALIILIIFITLPYMWFYSARDGPLIDYMECKGMTDLEYYGSEPAAKCYFTDPNKYQYTSDLNTGQYLDRLGVERLDAKCSSFKQSECQTATDCTWVSNDEAEVPATSSRHKIVKLTANTCRSAIMTGYNAWECDDVQKMFWEANGLHWSGTTRKRLNTLVRSSDGNGDAQHKISNDNYKLSADNCLKLKESKCVIKPEDSVTGCTDSEQDKAMCTPSAPSGAVATGNLADIVYGVNVPVYKKISETDKYDQTTRDSIKEWLAKYSPCSADEVAYVELRNRYKKWKNTLSIPDNCLSDQAGEGRSKYLDELLLRISMAQTGIILMMLEGVLIFILLVLEVLAGRKDEGAKMDQVTPV